MVKWPQDLQILSVNHFKKSKKNDSLTKKWNTFQLEGNELEQLLETDSKDIRTFRLKIWHNITVNITQVSDLILINWRLGQGLDLSVQVRSGRWFYFKECLLHLSCCFRILILLLVYNTLGNVLHTPCYDCLKHLIATDHLPLLIMFGFSSILSYICVWNL